MFYFLDPPQEYHHDQLEEGHYVIKRLLALPGENIVLTDEDTCEINKRGSRKRYLLVGNQKPYTPLIFAQRDPFQLELMDQEYAFIADRRKPGVIDYDTLSTPVAIAQASLHARLKGVHYWQDCGSANLREICSGLLQNVTFCWRHLADLGVEYPRRIPQPFRKRRL